MAIFRILNGIFLINMMAALVFGFFNNPSTGAAVIAFALYVIGFSVAMWSLDEKEGYHRSAFGFFTILSAIGWIFAYEWFDKGEKPLDIISRLWS